MDKMLYSIMISIISFFFPDPAPVTTPTHPTTTATSTSDHGGKIGERFAPFLVKIDSGSFVRIDPDSLNGVKYYAFYYSASWCPPCRAFTPTLVTFYNDFKRTHPNFELIFINEDRSESDMRGYMVDDSMMWPAVLFDEIRSSSLNVGQWANSGIPDLVLVDSNGNVLSDSFSGSTYLGPEKVVDDIRALVPAP